RPPHSPAAGARPPSDAVASTREPAPAPPYPSAATHARRAPPARLVATATARGADMPSKQPLVLGSPDQFAIVREAIDRAGYTEAEVVRRCELPSIYDYVNLRDGRTVAATITDAFDVLLRLFLDDEALPWATV